MVVREADIAEFKILNNEGLSNNEVAKITGFSSSTVNSYVTNKGLLQCEVCKTHRQKALYAHCKNDKIICKSCLRKQAKEKRKAAEEKIAKLSGKPHFLCFMGLVDNGING